MTETFTVEESTSHELERVEAVELAMVAQEMEIEDLVARHRKIQAAIEEVLVDGIDYGRIPGVNRPTLLKPGAEKLSQLFMLVPEIETQETYHEDGHYTVKALCYLHHVPTGRRLGPQPALATSRESKYAYRMMNPTCPDCGTDNIRTSKEGGYYCWRRIGGCGNQFAAASDKAKQIATQPTGRGPNPDLPDTYNTVLRMACKRAHVAATLAITGASEVFTSDIEDHAPADAQPDRADTPKPARKQTKAQTEEFNTLQHQLVSEHGLEQWATPAVVTSANRAFGMAYESLSEISREHMDQIIEGARKQLAAAEEAPQGDEKGDLE